ncbi:hypothetical protein THAOC_08230 [Thalassiosira oceanica]|uniref:Uncharacterized protein n=1 Tax=Thalassiosira oceanica TaxID=159749 RepID=K0SZI4_THAOC|nr:hypothetical protein THAOC_08230 [Thalassiosira oceanica]|eukprot:EJK70414.1 hypothetical protein THAOC_08230 [Thalassiosira oceanica]
MPQEADGPADELALRPLVLRRLPERMAVAVRSRGGNEEEMRRKCYICRARIPPLKEMVSSLLSCRAHKQQLEFNNDTSSERYHGVCQSLKQVEKEVGKDWDGVTVLEDGRKPAVVMPDYIHNAAIGVAPNQFSNGSMPIEQKIG